MIKLGACQGGSQMDLESREVIAKLCKVVDTAMKAGDYRPEKVSKYDVQPFIELVEAIPDPELLTTLKGLPERLMRFIGLYSPATAARVSRQVGSMKRR